MQRNERDFLQPRIEDSLYAWRKLINESQLIKRKEMLFQSSTIGDMTLERCYPVVRSQNLP